MLRGMCTDQRDRDLSGRVARPKIVKVTSAYARARRAITALYCAVAQRREQSAATAATKRARRCRTATTTMWLIGRCCSHRAKDRDRDTTSRLDGDIPPRYGSWNIWFAFCLCALTRIAESVELRCKKYYIYAISNPSISIYTPLKTTVYATKDYTRNVLTTIVDDLAYGR